MAERIQIILVGEEKVEGEYNNNLQIQKGLLERGFAVCVYSRQDKM